MPASERLQNCRGPKRRRITAVQQWGVVARLQPCRRPRRQSRPLRFPHRHPRRRPRLCERLGHPRPRRHPDLLIRTTARWECTRFGTEPSRRGAAIIIISAVSRLKHRARQIPTIARMDSQTGRQAGLWPRRSGVAEFMERDARIKAVVVPRSRQLRSRTIARQASQIGWQVGPWPRRPGAVRTRARAAHRQLVGAPEPGLVKWLMHDFGAGLRAIFRRHRHASSQASTRALWARHSLASALAPSSGAGLMSCSQWRDD